ncbi:MAG: cysteine synthase A [Pseudomonadales bacterium]|nr:cysteine synthase A [Pseudomonadales bacterium]
MASDSLLLNNILETIGNTPIVRINKLAPAHVNVYAKLESFNPMASVKDRLALGIIEDAEQSGALKPGQTVIEATSGNTGIGLAMVCAQKGYPLVVTMAESFSIERRKMMRFLGAKVVLTPAHLKGTGMLNKAQELADKYGWFLCHQFENEANANIHSKTTAEEILTAFADTHLDYWVTGYGTGGTLKGVSRVLQKKSPDTKVIVCEPDNSALLLSEIKQQMDEDGRPTASHSKFRPHLMQGWTPDFISKLTADSIDNHCVHQVLAIDGKKALQLSKDLAQKEGIFVGISAGATLAGALAVAEKAEAGSNILCMLPDTGERYLSTPLFDGISADMSDEEWQLSRATDAARFDQPSPVAPAVAAAPAPVIPAAEDYLQQLLKDNSQPVLLFALEWCEFCWSLRKVFAKLDIDYLAVDLDSVDFQEDDWGGQIRAALAQETDCFTIPQVFIAGEFIGGCSETMEALKSGEFSEKLCAAGSTMKAVDFDPVSFLPGWIQPR